MHFYYIFLTSPHESLLKSNLVEIRTKSGNETHQLKRCWCNGSFLQWLGGLKQTRLMEFASQAQ